MSEFMEKHLIYRVGAGICRYEEVAAEAIHHSPYFIMLDEVEKAHPDVFNIMLQVLDDGRLTDQAGENGRV